MSKVGRNDACRCGSGKKYKRCCMEADELQAKVKRLESEEARLVSEKARLESLKSAMRGLLEEEFVEFQRLTEEAQELIDSGRLDEAEELARALDAEYPEEPIGAERLAQVYEARGMSTASAEHYRRAVGIMEALGEGGYCDCCRERMVKAVARLDPEPAAPDVARGPA